MVTKEKGSVCMRTARGRAGLLAAAALTVSASLISAPHAFAGDDSTRVERRSGVAIADTADADARAFAKAHAAAVSEAATICGPGYEFVTAEALPSPDERYGTLFTYATDGASSACAVMDNNTGGGANYMRLEIWPGDNYALRDTDEGWFSQYAGPVYSSTEARNGKCVGIHATITNDAGTGYLVRYDGGVIWSSYGDELCGSFD